MESLAKQKVILVIDDDPQIRMMIAEVIESFGHICQTAADGLEALDMIQKEKFDIAICDIRMPGINGLELVERAKQINLDVPFIIMTGFSEEYSYERVIEVGAQDFIKKPFTFQELKAKFDRILKERHLVEERDKLLNKQVALNKKLSNFIGVAKDMNSELDFERLFPLIIKKITEAMEAERSSLYVIDWDQREIWTKVAEEVDEIRLPLGQGISGKVAETGEIINVEEARELKFFRREFDTKHGFQTHSVLCMPVDNRSGERIAVIQVLNKIGEKHFSQDDEDMLRGLTGHVAIALENALLLEELRVSFESSIRTLSATVDAKHPFTAGHSQRVTEYALMIAQEMKIDEAEQEVIKYAAILHDIGKIGIPDKVLLKDGPFTPEEREEMNTHPVKTQLILEQFHFPKALSQVPIIAKHHHEMVNGQGYPDGLKGYQLPLGSKILSVADVFDALTSKRDYPKYHGQETLSCDPMQLNLVISIFKEESGNQFDPDVVDAFLRILPSALKTYRGSHFTPAYVDETIQSLS